MKLLGGLCLLLVLHTNAFGKKEPDVQISDAIEFTKCLFRSKNDEMAKRCGIAKSRWFFLKRVDKTTNRTRAVDFLEFSRGASNAKRLTIKPVTFICKKRQNQLQINFGRMSGKIKTLSYVYDSDPGQRLRSTKKITQTGHSTIAIANLEYKKMLSEGLAIRPKPASTIKVRIANEEMKNTVIELNINKLSAVSKSVSKLCHDMTEN